MKKWTLIFAIVFVVSAIAFGISVAAYGVTWGEYGGLVPYYSESVPTSEQMPVQESELSADFDNLTVSIVSANTTIKYAEVDEVLVRYETGNASTTVDAQFVGDTLEIKENVNFFISVFGGSWRKSTLEITLPINKEIDKFKYNAVSGNVSVEGLTADEIELNSVSGDMKLGLFADKIKVNTVSGRVTVANCTDNACEKLEISSTSGDYEISGFHTEKFSIDTTSGNYNLEGMSGECEINATSGDIDIQYDEWNGDVKINLMSGDVRLIVPENSGADIHFDGLSGSVKADLDGKSATVSKGGSATGGGSNVHKVNVDATSGSVKIDNR